MVSIFSPNSRKWTRVFPKTNELSLCCFGFGFFLPETHAKVEGERRPLELWVVSAAFSVRPHTAPTTTNNHRVWSPVCNLVHRGEAWGKKKYSNWRQHFYQLLSSLNWIFLTAGQSEDTFYRDDFREEIKLIVKVGNRGTYSPTIPVDISLVKSILLKSDYYLP